MSLPRPEKCPASSLIRLIHVSDTRALACVHAFVCVRARARCGVCAGSRIFRVFSPPFPLLPPVSPSFYLHSLSVSLSLYTIFCVYVCGRLLDVSRCCTKAAVAAIEGLSLSLSSSCCVNVTHGSGITTTITSTTTDASFSN